MQKKTFNYKVLMLNGQSANTANATGITLSTVIRNIPNDKILEICFAEGDLVENAITSHVIPEWVNPLRYIFKHIIGGSSITARINQDIQRNRLDGKEMAVKRSNTLKEFVRSHLDVCPIYIDKTTRTVAQDFHPDIIYTLGSNVTVLKTALRISQLCDCPILLHFMDNWRESSYRSWAMIFPRKILDRYIRKIEKKSAVGLAISDMMAYEYTKQSGIKYYALMNAIDGELIRQPKVREDGCCTLVYTGGLHLNRHLSLLEVQTCLQRIKECGLPCKLLIYTSKNDRYLQALFDESIVTFMDYVPHDRIYDVYDSADILVHVESFDKEQVMFTKYSISTKISEYLSSGKPILCYAPQEIAVHQYVVDSKAGYSAFSPETLYDCLSKLIGSAQLRENFGANGTATARKRHTYEVAQELLYQAISENVAANRTKGLAY